MKLNICLAVALAGVWGWAEETPDEVPVVYPLYTVTTAGGTSSLSEVQISVVSEEGVDPVMKTIDEILPPDGGKVGGTFVKTGEGYLQSCDNMINFTGEIWIRQGALVAMGPGQLGPKDAGGDIHIADKASLGIDKSVSLSSQVMHIGNSMYLRGTGYEGRGVIYNDSPNDNMCACFHIGTFYFEDNATFGGTGSKWGDAGDFQGYQLNGHTLTIASKGQYRTNGGKFYNGHVVVTGGGLNPQSNLTYSGGTSNSLTFCENSRWAGYHAARFTFDSPWTLFLKNKVTFAFSGNLANAKKYWNSTTYDNWNGAAVVDGLVTVANTSFATNREAYSFIFNGPVSGPGGFKVTNGWLHFNNPTNTFTGPLSVEITGSKVYYGGLGFFNKDAFPADNDTVITNKNGAIYVTKNGTALPGIDCTIEGATFTNVVFFGAGSIVTKSFVKRGSGELKLEAPLVVDGRAELLEGTLSVDVPRSSVPTLYSSAPGLYESAAHFGTNEFPTSFTSDWYTNGKNSPTNGVTSYPVLAERTGTGGGWSKHTAARYQGYIWNRNPESVTWSFALTFATAGELWLDGERFVGSWNKDAKGKTHSCTWYYLRTNNVTLTTGPHKFDFRAYNNGYAEGGAKDAYATWNDAEGESYGNFTPTWPKNFGLVYKEGMPTLASSDYAIPQNGTVAGLAGGDGLLFTLDTRTPEECADEIAQIMNDLMRTNNVRTVFTNFLAAAGTVLNLQGSGVPLYVDDFEGSTCVKDGTFFICNSWTLSGDNVLPTDDTAVLSTDSGKVKFGNNAAIRLKNGKAFRRLTRRTSGKLLDAGYEGSPALLLDPEDPTFGCWKLRTEDDGLYLDYESGTVLIVR